MSLKFDHTKGIKLHNSTPNLSELFNNLKSTRTPLFINSNRFVHLFGFGIGMVILSTYLNKNFFHKGEDINIEFKILPDYITEKNVVTYRKAIKRFDI